MSKTRQNLQIEILKVEDRNFFNSVVKANYLHQQENQFVGSAMLRFSEQLSDMRLAWSVKDNRYVGCSAACFPHFSCIVYVLPFYRRKGIGRMLIHGMSTEKTDERKSLQKFFKGDS
jgi:GNAT superfamily N-acetyltransferase